jgi:hypothetical protein
VLWFQRRPGTLRWALSIITQTAGPCSHGRSELRVRPPCADSASPRADRRGALRAPLVGRRGKAAGAPAAGRGPPPTGRGGAAKRGSRSPRKWVGARRPARRRSRARYYLDLRAAHGEARLITPGQARTVPLAPGARGGAAGYARAYPAAARGGLPARRGFGIALRLTRDFRGLRTGRRRTCATGLEARETSAPRGRGSAACCARAWPPAGGRARRLGGTGQAGCRRRRWEVRAPVLEDAGYGEKTKEVAAGCGPRPGYWRRKLRPRRRKGAEARRPPVLRDARRGSPQGRALDLLPSAPGGASDRLALRGLRPLAPPLPMGARGRKTGARAEQGSLPLPIGARG